MRARHKGWWTRWWLGAAAAAVLGLGPVQAVRAAEPVPGDRAGPGAADEIRAVVLLVVLEDPRPGAAKFPEALVEEVAAALARVYQVEVRRLARRPLPRSAFRAKRKRYRADDLLEYLATQIPAKMPRRTRVLGLTTADISTSKEQFADWGVFGLGELDGTAAVVSSHRLRRKARDAAQVTWRVTNTAVHELGHVLGLDHCEEPRCVMLDAQGGIANTDGSIGGPGPMCQSKLDRASPLVQPAALVRPAR
jgi:archaemetzincin